MVLLLGLANSRKELASSSANHACTFMAPELVGPNKPLSTVARIVVTTSAYLAAVTTTHLAGNPTRPERLSVVRKAIRGIPETFLRIFNDRDTSPPSQCGRQPLLYNLFIRDFPEMFVETSHSLSRLNESAHVRQKRPTGPSSKPSHEISLQSKLAVSLSLVSTTLAATQLEAKTPDSPHSFLSRFHQPT